ncbi:MAG: class I SAM-dependent methyltransferase [Syntrophomonadaceae bacterium]|nr:class I SAM-dependent methyltransferase [Syntrophomonadaceae bacterium]
MNKTNPVEYEPIAREVFAPVYPVIAEEILRKTGRSQGKCVDLGTGPGYLGLEMARITDLEVWLLDNSTEMIAYAQQNIKARKLENRVYSICADVHQLPFADDSIDLMVSRGSVFFWNDLPQAFREIYRALKPGGMTYIGGGFGSEDLKRGIERKMREIDENWEAKAKKRLEHPTASDYAAILHKLNITGEIKITNGLWIIISKPAA